MTLQALFDQLGQDSTWLMAYFYLIITLTLAMWAISSGVGHLSPWKYIYAVLVYAVAIPGLFALVLNAYLFLFERRSILQTDVYTQLVPILAMLLVLWLIRRNVPFEYIPGFGKLSGLVMMIIATFALMWFADRTRIFMISYLPFQYVFGIFVALLAFMYWGWRRFFG